MSNFSNLLPMLERLRGLAAVNPSLLIHPKELYGAQLFADKVRILMAKGVPLIKHLRSNGFMTPRRMEAIEFAYFELLVSGGHLLYQAALQNQQTFLTPWLNDLLSLETVQDRDVLQFCSQSLVITHIGPHLERRLSPSFDRLAVCAIVREKRQKFAVEVRVQPCEYLPSGDMLVNDETLIFREIGNVEASGDTLLEQLSMLSRVLLETDRFIESFEASMSSWPLNDNKSQEELETRRAKADLRELMPSLSNAQAESFRRLMPDLMPGN